MVRSDSPGCLAILASVLIVIALAGLLHACFALLLHEAFYWTWIRANLTWLNPWQAGRWLWIGPRTRPLHFDLCHSRQTKVMPRFVVVDSVASNQSMKPTVPLRNKLTRSLPLTWPSACPSMSQHFPRAPFRVFSTTPSPLSRLPATLVRFVSSRSHTTAVLFFNDCRGL
jgi:hypothetical protein